MTKQISKIQEQIYFMVFILISHALIVFDAFYLIDLGVSLLRYLVFISVALQCLNKPINKFDIIWVVFFVYVVFTTLLGHGGVPQVIGPGIDISILLMMFHVYRDHIKNLLNAITFSLSFYIYLNLLLLIVFPEGLWIDAQSGTGFYLLSGNYNGIGARCLCALITNMLICKHNPVAKINFLLLMVVSLFSVVFVGSMTSTVSLIMLIGLWMFTFGKRHKTVVKAFLIVYLIIQVIFVFTLSDLSSYTYVVNFVENVLHKDLTFTTRTYLWANSTKLIAESPWLGYGFQPIAWNKEQLGGPGAHNFVYTMLLYGGYPLLLLFIGILLMALKRCKPYFNDKKLSRLLLGINTIFFMMIFDYYPIFIIVYFLALIYYYPIIYKSYHPDTDSVQVQLLDSKQ